ncbi:MAG: TolC family protein, partial [Candidatus Heimdallarchaeota archaeon]|nr:TolC family protein [Candidatus Heimdallarchaeota archaeon]
MNQRVYLKYVLVISLIFVVLQLGCNKSILDENYGDFVYPKSALSNPYEFSKDSNINVQMLKLQDVNKSLTLEDCYKIALMNNDGVILAGKGIEIAQTDLWVANLSWIPRLSIQGEVSYRNSENLTEYDNPSYDPLDPSSGSPTIQSKVGSQENASGLAEILFPIYLFGRIVNNVDLRTAKLDIAFADSRRTKQQIAYLVSQLYTTILELEKTVEVLKSSITVIEELLKNAKNFYNEGIITKNEVLVLEVTLSSRKQAMLEAENALKQTTYQFNSILNLNITRKTKLTKLDELPMFMLSEVPLINLALHYRPEIVKSMSSFESSAAQLRLAQCNRWPLLYGFVDITAASEAALVNNAWMTFGARMQWQILDSGTTSAMIRQAKTAIEMQKLQTRMLFKDIMIDVRSS